MRVVLSGGGSAGHITPTLAVSDALRSRDNTIEQLYIGQAGSMEERIVRAKGLDFAVVRAGKFRRNHFDHPLQKILNMGTLGPNSRDAVRTVAGVADALGVLRHYRPDVVFIKGGFVGVPVGVAARLMGIPYIIHESDIVPGLANRLLARWAARIAVGFPVKHYKEFDPARLVYTGNPVRQEVLSAHRLAGLAHFKFRDDLPVILVTGGSQGSRQINDCLLEALPQLTEVAQVIHLTGETEFERLQFAQRNSAPLAHPERYRAHAFLLADMPLAIAAADLVIGRAGVNTIVELAALSKPTILIPNYEMAGHQVANAKVLARAGAARVLDGRTLTATKLVAEVRHILDDPEEQARLAKAIHQFGATDAAEQIADVICEVAASRVAATAVQYVQKPNIDAKDEVDEA